MSFLSALHYPLRGKNSVVFMALALIWFIVSGLLSRANASNIANLVFSLLATAYYFSALKNLFEGQIELPNLIDATGNIPHSSVLAAAQFVYGFLVFLLWLFFPNPVVLIAAGILAYLLLAVGTIRLAVEANWTAPFDVFANLNQFLMRPVSGLKLLFFGIGLLSVSFIANMGFSLFFTSLFGLLIEDGNTRLLLTNNTMNLFSAFIGLYLVLANTYLWYGFGYEMGIAYWQKTKISAGAANFIMEAPHDEMGQVQA